MHHRIAIMAAAVNVAFCLLTPVAGAQTMGDAQSGEKIYKRVCIGCHAIDSDEVKVGPSLKSVVNRQAGSVPGSSPALSQSNLSWTKETFDRYMENPTAVVPGTTMLLQINDAKSRADLYAYLQTVSNKK